MFGRLLRAAGAFAAMALVGTILKVTLDKMIPVAQTGYNNSSSQYNVSRYNDTASGWFQGIETYWLLIGLLTILLALIYGAYIESKKGGPGGGF